MPATAIGLDSDLITENIKEIKEMKWHSTLICILDEATELNGI